MTGTLKIQLAKGALQTDDVVSAVQYIGSIVSPRSNDVRVDCTGGFNVITQHNDNFRTGAYLAESTLLPDAVLRQGTCQPQQPLDAQERVLGQAVAEAEGPPAEGAGRPSRPGALGPWGRAGGAEPMPVAVELNGLLPGLGPGRGAPERGPGAPGLGAPGRGPPDPCGRGPDGRAPWS